MDEYKATLESIGDAIIQWADPESQFTGFNKVRDDGKRYYVRTTICFNKGAQDFELYANCESNRFICHGIKIIIFQSNPILKTYGV